MTALSVLSTSSPNRPGVELAQVLPKLALAPSGQRSTHRNAVRLPPLSEAQASQISQAIAFWDADFKLPRSQINSIRSEIAQFARDPASTLAFAMSRNRVLAFGENHFNGEHRVVGARLMPTLKANGATHLALEIPVFYQGVLDQFSRTGKTVDLKGLPDFLQDNDYLGMLISARNSGLKLVAVDAVDASRAPDNRELRDLVGFVDMLNVSANGIANGGRIMARKQVDRDTFMADKIASVLESDPRSKVVFWAGANHVARKQGSAVSHLAPRFTTASVNTMVDRVGSHSLGAITRDLPKPVVVVTSEAKQVAALRPGSNPKETYAVWDAVLLTGSR